MIPSKNISHSTVGNCFQIYSSQKKGRASSLENPCGFIFPTLGLRRVLQYILLGMSKNNSLSVICLGARVMFLQ